MASAWTCSICTVKHEGLEAEYLACTVCGTERATDPDSTSKLAVDLNSTGQNSNSTKKRCSSNSPTGEHRKKQLKSSSKHDNVSEPTSKSTSGLFTSVEMPITTTAKVQVNRPKQMSLTEMFPTSNLSSRNSNAIANPSTRTTGSADSDAIGVLVDSVDLAKSSDDRKSWIEVWGSLPAVARLDENQFKTVWNMHPAEKGQIKMMGKIIETPRWTQTYLRAYNYSGMVHIAKELPSCLQPLFDWARTKEPRLNGALVNWYQTDHKMGRHSDDERDLIPATDIFSFSFGGERVFRVSAKKKIPSGFTGIVKRKDFVTRNNSLIIMRGWMQSTHDHEVPIFKTKISSNRINVTFRCFK
eukprot:m.50294 g.50294  ORF g.50294 m.50294 type:complete len:356 (-) comp21254_c0_seq1:249-1316(-)